MDFVRVQAPNHGEGQSFKMDRKKAEQFVQDVPGAKILDAETAGEEAPAAGGEAKAMAPTEDKAVAGPVRAPRG